MTNLEFKQKYPNIKLKVFYSLPSFVSRTVLNNEAFVSYDLVQEYKKNYLSYLDSDILNAPFSSCTHEHFHSIRLEKARLSKLGLRKKYQNYHCDPSARLELESTGVYNTVCLTENTVNDISYLQEDGRIVSESHDKSEVAYHILYPHKAKESNHYKIIQRSENAYPHPGRILPTKILLSVSIMTVFFIIFILETFFFLRDDWTLYFPFGIPTFLISAFGFFLLFKNLLIYKRLTDQFRNYSKSNLELPQSNFVSSLENKIRLLHYANSFDDVSILTKCNINSFLQNSQDIFNCKFGKSKLSSVTEIMNHKTATLTQAVCVQRYSDGNVSEESYLMTIDFQKDVKCNPIKLNTFSTCPSCRKEHDWYSAATCPHCNLAPVYEQYDWVVTDVNIQPFKNEKEKKKWFLICPLSSRQDKYLK